MKNEKINDTVKAISCWSKKGRNRKTQDEEIIITNTQSTPIQIEFNRVIELYWKNIQYTF